MNAHKPLSVLRHHTLISLGMALALCSLLVWGLAPSRAQDSAQDGAAASAPEEREVEDRIPKHLPIKIKLKKPEKVKDLKNSNWLGDLEVEVKNTGEKPIYFLRIIVSFEDVKMESGAGIAYQMFYGRPELISIGNRATPEDVPIRPGETYTFKLKAGLVRGWKWATEVEKMPHPKKIAIEFGELNHGDGTGYVSTGGLPVPEEKSYWQTGRKGSGALAFTSTDWLDAPHNPSGNSSHFYRRTRR